jgi:hypothetical protein
VRAAVSNSRRFPLCPGDKLATPVRFPPGRAKLSTSPAATGSATAVNTIGIWVVARFAACAWGVPKATMTSTLSWTSSEATLSS